MIDERWIDGRYIIDDRYKKDEWKDDRYTHWLYIDRWYEDI